MELRMDSTENRRAAISRLLRTGASICAAAWLAAADGGRAQPAAAQMTWEEFMAEKRLKEKQERLRQLRAQGLTPPEDLAPPAAATSSAPSGAAGGNAPSRPAEPEYAPPKPDPDPLKTLIVTILRIQESTLQEERLIKTGKFADLQRNSIKMAVRMMIDNNRITDVIVKASSYARPDKVNECSEAGKAAIEDLQTILDYFDEGLGGGEGLKITELDSDKKQFISRALKSCRDRLETVLSYLPVEKISAARQQVLAENELNLKELRENNIQVLNPIFMN